MEQTNKLSVSKCEWNCWGISDQLCFCSLSFCLFIPGICICGDIMLWLQYGDGIQEVDVITRKN